MSINNGSLLSRWCLRVLHNMAGDTQVAIAALVVSLVALCTTVSQLLAQFFATADGECIQGTIPQQRCLKVEELSPPLMKLIFNSFQAIDDVRPLSSVSGRLSPGGSFAGTNFDSKRSIPHLVSPSSSTAARLDGMIQERVWAMKYKR